MTIAMMSKNMATTKTKHHQNQRSKAANDICEECPYEDCGCKDFKIRFLVSHVTGHLMRGEARDDLQVRFCIFLSKLIKHCFFLLLCFLFRLEITQTLFVLLVVRDLDVKWNWNQPTSLKAKLENLSTSSPTVPCQNILTKNCMVFLLMAVFIRNLKTLQSKIMSWYGSFDSCGKHSIFANTAFLQTPKIESCARFMRILQMSDSWVRSSNVAI